MWKNKIQAGMLILALLFNFCFSAPVASAGGVVNTVTNVVSGTLGAVFSVVSSVGNIVLGGVGVLVCSLGILCQNSSGGITTSPTGAVPICQGTVSKAGVNYGLIATADAARTTSKCWLDRNLGATQIATSPTDTAAYGWLYQWGRGTDGHQIPTSATIANPAATYRNKDTVPAPNAVKFFVITTPTTYDWRNPQKNTLWQGINGINNPCPTGFRLPTVAELQGAIDAYVPFKGISQAYTFNTPLKLPSAGWRGFSSTNGGPSIFGLYDQGAWADLWTSDISGIYAKELAIDNFGNTYNWDTYRRMGASVRCISDFPFNAVVGPANGGNFAYPSQLTASGGPEYKNLCSSGAVGYAPGGTSNIVYYTYDSAGKRNGLTWTCLGGNGGANAIGKANLVADNSCQANTCNTTGCYNNLGDWLVGTKVCDNGCAANTCTTATCNNGSAIVWGTKASVFANQCLATPISCTQADCGKTIPTQQYSCNRIDTTGCVGQSVCDATTLCPKPSTQQCPGCQLNINQGGWQEVAP